MRIALAGAGAFGEKHLDGLKLIDGVEIVSIISRRLEANTWTISVLKHTAGAHIYSCVVSKIVIVPLSPTAFCILHTPK